MIMVSSFVGTHFMRGWGALSKGLKLVTGGEGVWVD
jgi:hypothetical protein